MRNPSNGAAAVVVVNYVTKITVENNTEDSVALLSRYRIMVKANKRANEARNLALSL